MKTLLILDIILNTIYLSVTLWKMKRVPESISETSYMWESSTPSFISFYQPKHKAINISI